MWTFFEYLIISILTDQGQLDEYLSVVFVVLINFLNKAPEQIKTITFPGQQGTCLDMIFALV
jgi:hypothetical protein